MMRRELSALGAGFVFGLGLAVSRMLRSVRSIHAPSFSEGMITVKSVIFALERLRPRHS